MIRSLIALPLLATAVAPQDVQLNARVVAVEPALCPNQSFKVDGSNVFLDDTLVDLAPFVGEIVLLAGNESFAPASCAPVTIEVTSVAPPTATLEHCGTNAIGCPMRFLVGPNTISVNLLAYSVAEQTFLDAGPLGVLFLGAPVGILDPGPGGITDIVAPSVPSLIGADVTLQGFHQEVGPIGDAGFLTNPVHFEIVVAILCHPPTCGF